MTHRTAPEQLPRAERGVVLLALLLAMTLLGIGLMVAVDVWSLSRQRERERELLFVGEQYRLAIRSYYLTGGRALPPNLDVLLDDDRFAIPKHHLRRAYPDPITGSTEWGQVRVGDRIIGVYSLSEKQPIKRTGFSAAYQHFNDAPAYRDWIFAFQLPRGRRGALPQPPAASGPQDGKRTPVPSAQRRSS